ncbi:unnamed protein product, partial [Prorocentrum cordatum]
LARWATPFSCAPSFPSACRQIHLQRRCLRRQVAQAARPARGPEPAGGRDGGLGGEVAGARRGTGANTAAGEPLQGRPRRGEAPPPPLPPDLPGARCGARAGG